jgi:ABC-type Fe3+ transport system permease subunit
MPGFLAQHASEIAELTLEHLWLTGSAMLLAAAIGVPTGIWLTRHPRWAKPVLGVVNIIQTIPSLALFGFLLPLPWIGDRAARIAIAALTAYALLPIVRNTYAGIEGVDPTVLEVAKALGMTSGQRLRKVELPLLFWPGCARRLCWQWVSPPSRRRSGLEVWANLFSVAWPRSIIGWCSPERSRRPCWRLPPTPGWDG